MDTAADKVMRTFDNFFYNQGRTFRIGRFALFEGSGEILGLLHRPGNA